jgi:hypothetical protein
MRTTLILALAVLGACAPSRPTLTPAELADRRRAYIETVNAERAAHAQAILRRIEQEADGDATLDLLVLSSGGQYGAFGSGFLEGWGDVEGEMARPVFDVVTGVSAGALMAPFAYLGDDESYRVVYEAYRDPGPGMMRTRGLLFFLPRRTSFLDNSALESLVEEFIDDERTRRIARVRREESRVLLIGTHNLDEGLMRTWSVGLEAARPDGVDRVRRILLASAAIPVVFPPIEIDGALYADGAVSSPLFLGTGTPLHVAALWQEANPELAAAKIRVWVIVNEKLSSEPRVAQPAWLDVGIGIARSMMRSGTYAALRTTELMALYLRERGADVEFRFVHVPADFEDPPAQDLFDRQTMQRLSDRGVEMGRDPASWLTHVPGFEWPEVHAPNLPADERTEPP